MRSGRLLLNPSTTLRMTLVMKFKLNITKIKMSFERIQNSF